MVMIKAINRWESRLLALDCALADVCEEHGISPDDMRRLAEAEVYEPLLHESVLAMGVMVLNMEPKCCGLILEA